MANYNIEIRSFNGSTYDTLYPLTIIQNVQGLQSTLNTKATLLTFTTTLQPSNWSGNGSTSPYTQQISFSGVLSTSNIFLNIIPSTDYITSVNQVNQFQYISYTTPLNGIIRFTCVSIKPTIALPIKILCLN